MFSSAFVRTYFTGIFARYLYGEILRAFVLALITISGIFVLFVVMVEAAQKGLTPREIAVIAPLIVPGSLPYTVPVSLLFAVSVVYGRIASDNEVIAIKTSGQSAMIALWPGLFLGLVLSVTLNYLCAEAIPLATHGVQKFIFGNMEEIFYKFLKKDREINNPEWPFLIKVGDVDGRTMIDATFKHRAGKGIENVNRFDTVIQASTATIKFDIENRVARVFLGKDAEVKTMGPKASTAIINGHEFEMDLPAGFSKKRVPSYQEMTFREMAREQHQLELSIARERKIQAAAAAMWIGSGRIDRVDWKDIHGAFFAFREWQSRYNGIETERSMRIALACGSFFFVALGAPVGILFAKRDFLSAFITCFVPIIIIYYPLTMAGVNLGKEGIINPLYALWMGNLVLAVLAGRFALPPVWKH